MNTKPLIETNPYLKDSNIREKLLDRSVVSSCAVEGIRVDFKKMQEIHIPRRGNKKIYQKVN